MFQSRCAYIGYCIGSSATLKLLALWLRSARGPHTADNQAVCGTREAHAITNLLYEVTYCLTLQHTWQIECTCVNCCVDVFDLVYDHTQRECCY